MKAYCPSCRLHFVVDATPPYGVIHAGSGDDLKHLHPITREEVYY